MLGFWLKTASLLITYVLQIKELRVEASAELSGPQDEKVVTRKVELKATVLSEEKVKIT